jgi:glycosyltransferase involved in cell wall biosynthesis
MRILCVIDSLGSGGAQRQLVELAIGFKERQHEVSFLVYHNEPFYHRLLEQKGIEIRIIEEANYLRRLIRMRSHVRRGGYDAVLSFLEAASFMCEIAGLPFRRWGLIVGERGARQAVRRSVKAKLHRWFHVLADYVVANSHAGIEPVRSINPLLSNSKCKVIYNIVDLKKWKPRTTGPKAESRRREVVVAASHQHVKNLVGLVKAVDLLSAEERSKLRIRWYGDRIEKPYFDSSFEKAQQLIKERRLRSVFQFHSATPELVEVFKECDAIGLFSYYEGFPNAVCEGMACGKPVICTAVSDLPVVLSHHPELMCSASDAESIRRSLSYILGLNDDTLEQIGKQNRLIAERYFGKSGRVSAYLSLMVR